MVLLMLRWSTGQKTELLMFSWFIAAFSCRKLRQSSRNVTWPLFAPLGMFATFAVNNVSLRSDHASFREICDMSQ